MPTPPGTRSIKISDDERGGWSSDRPRRDGAPRRPPDLSVRCQVLRPTDRVRYSPGSLLVVVSASADERDAFVERVLETRAPVLSIGKVRDLIAGRVGDDELEARAGQLLDAAVLKRLQAGDTVVVPAQTLDAAERERYLRMAAPLRRPRIWFCWRRAPIRFPRTSGQPSTTCAGAWTPARWAPRASRPPCDWAERHGRS